MSIVLLGSTSGSCTLQEQAVAGTTTLTLPTFNGTVGLLVSGTVNAGGANPFNNTLSSIDFTGIPAGVRRITVMFNGVSTNGTSALMTQIGNGAIVNSGYTSATTGGYSGNLISGASFTTGFGIQNSNLAANNNYATVTIANISGNTWYYTSVLTGAPAQFANMVGGGSITLGGVLDRIRITTVNGTDTFDAGSLNILYE